jgi:hypothetical protein
MSVVAVPPLLLKVINTPETTAPDAVFTLPDTTTGGSVAV